MLNKPLLGVAIAVALLGAGSVYFLRSRSTPPPETAAAPLERETAADAQIEHPVPNADDESNSAPLPDLAASDAPLREALGPLAGAAAVQNYLVPDDLIRRLVVTVDNLPRRQVAVDKRPTLPLEGSFAASGDELHARLDERNFDRYKPLVAVIERLDMQQLAKVYVHFYPLFQQSYQGLGYPNGYFNDRLVQVIDSLLATPDIKGPIELSRPNVMYTFADPALEARPAGQKLLLRMGRENSAAIKAKLIELKAAVTADQLRH